MGQLIAAMIVVENLNLMFYIPVLVIAGVITGILIGIVAKMIIPAVGKILGQESK